MAKLNINIGKKGLKMASAVAGAVLAMGMSANSYGALLVDFKPEPSPAGQYEVQYGGTPAQLIAIDGAIGNSSVETAPGLTIETPHLIALPAAYSPSVVYSGSTTQFKDVTLVFSNLTANGVAKLTEIAPGQNLITQALNTGTFELLSYDPAGSEGKITLLKGTIENAVITGLSGAQAGGVFSAKVTYTGGLIKNNLSESDLSGDLSWSLLEINPTLSATAAGPVLNGFKASLVGQFGVVEVPEPASLSLLALAGAGLVARRRSR